MEGRRTKVAAEHVRDPTRPNLGHLRPFHAAFSKPRRYSASDVRKISNLPELSMATMIFDVVASLFRNVLPTPAIPD